MKLFKKLLLILIVLLTPFIYSQHVHAEAGLSEAGRTEFYKFKNDFGFMILPGGEGGNQADLINIITYEKNNDNGNIFSDNCSGKYKTKDDNIYFPISGYAKSSGDYIYTYDESSNIGYILDLNKNDISQFDPQLNSSSEEDLLTREDIANIIMSKNQDVDLSEPLFELKIRGDRNLFNETLKKLGVDENNSTTLTYSYIKGNYDKLDIDPLSGMSCGFTLFFLALICGLVVIVILIALAIFLFVKWIIKRNHKAVKKL